jgi:hypothetical protein
MAGVDDAGSNFFPFTEEQICARLDWFEFASLLWETQTLNVTLARAPSLLEAYFLFSLFGWLD